MDTLIPNLKHLENNVRESEQLLIFLEELKVCFLVHLTKIDRYDEARATFMMMAKSYNKISEKFLVLLTR